MKKIRIILDILLTSVLILAMAYQLTGYAVHEWTGIVLTAAVIAHLVLNRRFFTSFKKGRYNAYRTFVSVSDILLLVCFFMTALCGMSMSSEAVPFLNGIIPLQLARQLHLSLSYWTFALTGLHIGSHLSVPIKKAGKKSRITVLSLFAAASAAGLYLIIKNGVFRYLFFLTRFAFFDYGSPKWFVPVGNVLMLMFFAFIGILTALLIKRAGEK